MHALQFIERKVIHNTNKNNKRKTFYTQTEAKTNNA